MLKWHFSVSWLSNCQYNDFVVVPSVGIKRVDCIKCVQRELLCCSLNRRAVPHADALLQTTYVTSDVCDQKCDGPTNAWVVRCLSWKTISVPWYSRDYWHDGRANNSNKTANNAKYSSCKGLNQETYDISLQNLRSGPFEFCLQFEFYFYPFSVYLHAKHDSFCA